MAALGTNPRADLAQSPQWSVEVTSFILLVWYIETILWIYFLKISICLKSNEKNILLYLYIHHIYRMLTFYLLFFQYKSLSTWFYSFKYISWDISEKRPGMPYLRLLPFAEVLSPVKVCINQTFSFWNWLKSSSFLLETELEFILLSKGQAGLDWER